MYGSHNFQQTSIEAYWAFKKTIQNLDNIRFQPYRIASKLKHLQNESKFYLIDLFNTIESFREFGLNSTVSKDELCESLISYTEVHSLLYSLFYHLNRRSADDIDAEHSIVLVYNWLLDTFRDAPEGFLNKLALKISLTLLCSALYSNKLRYFFTLLSDENGFLVESSFLQFLRYLNDICNYFENNQLITSETDLFQANNQRHQLFTFTTLINSNKFIETLNNFDNNHIESAIAWVVVYHRLFDAESVTHNIRCDSCGKDSFSGFRYKCKICYNYNQCQECFWIGRSTKNHDPDFHPSKEYLFDNHKNQLRRSFRKSFRNSIRRFVPPKLEENSLHSNNDKLIVKKLNLSNIISPSAFRKNNRKTLSGTGDDNFKFDDYISEYSPEELSICADETTNSEHNLIEHYLRVLRIRDSKLHSSTMEMHSQHNYQLPLFDQESDLNNDKFEKQILELEQKNCELMKRIVELNTMDKMLTSGTSISPSPSNAHFLIGERNVVNNDMNDNYHHQTSVDINIGGQTFFNELSMLRQKKLDLENYLNNLQNRRKRLIYQLDDLMKELKKGSSSENSS